MRLSIAFPVDLAELEGFVLAARHLGATAVEVEAGRTTGDAELVVMVPAVAPTTGAASAPPVEAEPPAPVAPAPAPVRTAKPARAKSARAPGEVKSGTCSHAILTAVADAGGTIPSTSARVGAIHGTDTDMANKKTAPVLVRDGFLATTPHTGPTSLTAKGWAAIGRTAPTTRPAPPAPVAEARPAPPKPIDLGPIERRPFDPDRVRQSQAEAS